MELKGYVVKLMYLKTLISGQDTDLIQENKFFFYLLIQENNIKLFTTFLVTSHKASIKKNKNKLIQLLVEYAKHK